jgi:hypothetical protein
MRRQPERLGRDLAADRIRLSTYEQVQPTPKRVGKRADASGISIDEGHGHPL